VSFVLSFGDDIRECLNTIHPDDTGDPYGAEGFHDEAAIEEDIEIEIDSRPAVELVNKIIEEAYKLGASDIHIEPYGNVEDAEVR
jgi:type II secretory ATPase GspE/PulE/Tfp pilus assembly ATPase PilB-like protein